jgi:hypothetical protein
MFIYDRAVSTVRRETVKSSIQQYITITTVMVHKFVQFSYFMVATDFQLCWNIVQVCLKNLPLRECAYADRCVQESKCEEFSVVILTTVRISIVTCFVD